MLLIFLTAMNVQIFTTILASIGGLAALVALFLITVRAVLAMTPAEPVAKPAHSK